jgi:hypothetical protein
MGVEEFAGGDAAASIVGIAVSRAGMILARAVDVGVTVDTDPTVGVSASGISMMPVSSPQTP